MYWKHDSDMMIRLERNRESSFFVAYVYVNLKLKQYVVDLAFKM